MIHISRKLLLTALAAVALLAVVVILALRVTPAAAPAELAGTIG